MLLFLAPNQTKQGLHMRASPAFFSCLHLHARCTSQPGQVLDLRHVKIAMQNYMSIYKTQNNLVQFTMDGVVEYFLWRKLRA